ncbi:MAG: flagellar hook-basal body complex protein FliE, partial [Verrucomicrobiota bacterium]|nr:flagellar hook-basal body complex protein FliE [Verrucomicrobiota bacterium]
MQPVSFNTNPLTRNMLDGHVAQTQAMEAMARQMQGLGQSAQVPSSFGQVSPVGPSAAPASPGQVQPADGGVFDNVLGKFVHEVNDKHATMGNTLKSMLAGENVPMHQVMTEFQEAGVAFTM